MTDVGHEVTAYSVNSPILRQISDQDNEDARGEWRHGGAQVQHAATERGATDMELTLTCPPELNASCDELAYNVRGEGVSSHEPERFGSWRRPEDLPLRIDEQGGHREDTQEGDHLIRDGTR